MKKDALTSEVDWTIKRVSRLVPKDRRMKKNDFEAILNEIIMCLHRNRKLSIESLAEKTDKVVTDMPHEYGLLPEKDRSWEHLVGYLYGEYLKELGQP